MLKALDATSACRPPSVASHAHPRTCTHAPVHRGTKQLAATKKATPRRPSALAFLFLLQRGHRCSFTCAILPRTTRGGRRGRMLTVNRLGSRNAPLGAARLQSWVMVAVGDLDGRTQVHKATSRPPHAPALIHPLDPPTHPPTRLRPCTHKQAPWPQQRAKASAVVVDGGEPGRCERVACPP